jgi:hypothetical protein
MIRHAIRALGILCATMLVVAGVAAVASPGNPLTPFVLHALGFGLGAKALTAMVIIPWSPAMTRDELEAIVNPQQANQPEVVPWQLFDTQDIANAAAGPFVFFGAQNNDKTLCNMEGPGQLPDPQYFQAFYLAADILQVPAATALANEPNSSLANVENILKTCRATFTLNMSNKRYGPFSLTMAHSTGGATGSGYGYGTAANGTSAFLVNNGIPGSGGFPFSGAVVIPPKTGFDVTVNLGVAATILVATVKLRLSLVGNLYRRVL